MRTLRDFAGVVLVFGFLSLGAAPALARIGGGQHYHGSSSRSTRSYSSSHSSSYGGSSFGSHSHSYGSSSSSSGGGFCSLLCIVVLIVGVLLYVNYAKKQRAQGGIPTPQPPADEPPNDQPDAIDAWIAALRQKDPNFDPQRLYGKVTDIFLRSQQAWSSRQLQPVRAFMSDATFQRFETQLELMHAQNVRNATADQQVEGIEWIGLEQNPFFDTVHLLIRARMRDTDVPWDLPDAEAQARAQRAPMDAFTEIWSFVRKPGAKSEPGKDLTQGKCPNCGAPFAGGAANTCEYCGAVVNSGNYDWTLAEITQSEEREQNEGDENGADEIRESDPAFSLEVLEDRTSLVFWKWIEARSAGQAAKVAKVATPSFVQTLSAELEGRARVHRECAVGAVVTRNVAAGPDGGARGLVEVLWSASIEGSDPSSLRSTFVMVRGPGAKTNAANGMSTARCPKCNAPLTGSLSSTCDFCGTALDSNPSDWRVDAVRTEEL